MPLTRIPLDNGWQFKQSTDLNNGTAKDWLPVGQFPTVAHIDLLHHGLIKDPYIDTNELDSLWVNDADVFLPFPLPFLSPISSPHSQNLGDEIPIKRNSGHTKPPSRLQRITESKESRQN
jgi:beta-mannosidase